MYLHEEIQDLLPGYVLGALDAHEAAQAEAHLASCQSSTTVLAEYQSVASVLAYSVPMVWPPHDLKARTIQRALATDRLKTGVEATVRAQRSWLRSWFAPACVRAALFIALVALGLTAWQAVELSRQLQAQRDILTVVAYEQGTAQIVHGTENAPNALGRLYLDLDSTVAALVTANMPPLGPDRVYQVWLTTGDGRKVSGGVFQVDAEGNGLLLLRTPHRLDTYVQVEVTDEPGGGSFAPTTTPLLLMELTSQ